MITTSICETCYDTGGADCPPPVNPSFGLTGKLGGAQKWTIYGKIILKNKVKLGKISQK